MPTYIAIIHKADKESAPHGVMFPDFPGCLSSGKTIGKALDNAKLALLFHIKGMQKLGEPIPKPSSKYKLLKNADNRIGTMLSITITLPPVFS